MTGSSGPGISLKTEGARLGGDGGNAADHLRHSTRRTLHRHADERGAIRLEHRRFRRPRRFTARGARAGERRGLFLHAIEAVNIARKYNVPVLILSDQAIATRIEAFEEPTSKSLPGHLAGPAPGARSQALRPRCAGRRHATSPPGTRIMSGKYPIVTGLEHDELGHPTGSPKLHMQMTAKRRKKLQALGRTLPLPSLRARRRQCAARGLGLDAGSDSRSGRSRARRRRQRFLAAHRHISPCRPAWKISFAGFNHVFVVEMNDEGLYGYGQLAGLLRARYCDPKIRGITKPTVDLESPRHSRSRQRQRVTAGLRKLLGAFIIMCDSPLLTHMFSARELNSHQWPRRSPARRGAQRVDQKRNGRRSPDVVPGLRRFLRPRALLQADREAQTLAREDHHRRRHRLLQPVPLFRPGPRRALHSRPRAALRERHFVELGPTCTCSSSAAMATRSPSAAIISITPRARTSR